MIGREVDGGDVGGAGFVKGGDEGVVGGGEAVVGGDDEHGAGGEFWGEGRNVPGGCVCDDLFGEAQGRAAGEGRHAFGGEVGGESGGGFFLLTRLEGLHSVDAHVGCGDQADSFDGRFLCADVSGHEAAHTVADENDVGGVGAEFARVGGVAQVGDGGLRVFDGVSEGEVAGRAPGAAVVEVNDVPTVAADGLREIEILFVAGEAVKEEDDRVWACSLGDVGKGVEHGSVAGDLKALHSGWVCLVWPGVRGDGGGELLRLERKTKRGEKIRGD